MGRLGPRLSGLAVVAATWSAVLAGAQGTAALVTVPPGGLEAALQAAQPGDTLRLQTGIHPAPLVIERAVRLVGEPGAIIRGDGHGTVLTVAADGVEIVGLGVDGGGSDLAGDDAVILLLEVEAVTVRDCRIAARGFGIYLRAGGHHRILQNTIVGDPGLPVARRGNGIHLWHTTDNEIADNEIAATRDGVYLSFAHDNSIRGNHGEGLRYGIHYMYSERNTLTANRFSGGVGGIALMFSLGNVIAGNRVVANRDFGILLQQLERSVLRDNVAEGNGRGFFLENSAGNRLLGNRLLRNGVGAYLTAASERNVFAGNAFDDNIVQVYEAHAGDNDWSEQGRGNWWSDYGGFDWNGDGLGDSPYRLQTATSALLARRPGARWFWKSPILGLLDWWQERLPAARLGFDPYPLAARP